MTKPKESKPKLSHQELLERKLGEVSRLLRGSLETLEQEYIEAKKLELEKLHNRLIDVVADEGASPQNVLLVLELMRQEVLQDCMEKFFNNREELEPSKTAAPKPSGSAGPGVSV